MPIHTRAAPSVLLAALVLVSASVPAADGPAVVASIRPVHSLVAGVMAGVGTPVLLVPPRASPHSYALKPSDARSLAAAAVVFRVGPELEVFLDRPLRTLARGARLVELMRVPGVRLLRARQGGVWDGDGQGDGRGRAGDDPHLWLDPDNAGAWVREIARQLALADAAHAGLYARNAAALQARLAALAAAIDTVLSPVRDRPYIVFHDAYQYFEQRFSMRSIGAITVSPARPPGARRLHALKAMLRERKPVCVFAEPQFRPGLIRTVVEGTAVRAGTLDPVGIAIPSGPDMYFRLLQGIAAELRRCLAG